MLKDLTTQSYTLYSSCLDHVNELDDLLENRSVHKVSCRSRRQRKPRWQQSPDSYVDSSSGCSLTTEYDSEFDSFYNTASELDTKGKPSFSSKFHVELPSDCRQCRSMHLCNNDGGRCVDIRVDTPDSRNKTTTSSKTENSFWPLSIMGSSDYISSFNSWSSLSSSRSSLSTLVSVRSEMSEAIHAPPVVSKDEPCSTNKGPAGRSELNNPLPVELQGMHSLENSIWKEATKKIPELVFNVEEEKHRTMVCDKVTDPEQENAKTPFQKSLAMFEYLIKMKEKSFGKLSKMNSTDISRVAFNDQKREKMDLLSKPQGNACPNRLVKKLVGPGIHIPIPRVKHVLFMERASIQLLEMNLKQKRLENVLGAPTIFSKSMELITPEETSQPKEVTSSEVELEFNCSKTLFISKEMRDKLEFHIKRKKIQHLWGLPHEVTKSIEALIPKAPNIDHSRVSPKPKYDIEVMTSDLPFLTDEQKEALEGNVRKKKAHKNWGYPKRIMDSLKAFEVPESVAKDLYKRSHPGAKVQHPRAASKFKDIPVEPKEPQTSATSKTNDLKEMSKKQQNNQNNSHSLSESSAAEIQERGFPKVAFGPFSKKCFHSEYPVLTMCLKCGSNLNKYSLHKGSNVHRELIARSTEGEGRDNASPQTQTTCLSEQPSVSTSRPCRFGTSFFITVSTNIKNVLYG
ncbi:uncharacterized protein LOC118363756 [Oncorhynchus keta]|uniref:uncharacterized protein LOC118363756 n=1 Tax=Oncorhynchus keta TaxID=8018 RepID=UPI00227C61BA|nr:uncharacterized protein LOC118363756 [Oncorhynchus keta]